MFKGIGNANAETDRAAVPPTGIRCRSWGIQAVLLAALALSGCASMKQGDQVFLQQNRAALALTQAVMAAEDENPEAVDLLYESEAELNEACGALQEVAYRRMQKEPVTPWLKLAAYGSLDGCAAQCRATEGLLWQIDPATATHYLDQPLVSALAEQ